MSWYVSKCLFCKKHCGAYGGYCLRYDKQVADNDTCSYFEVKDKYKD